VRLAGLCSSNVKFISVCGSMEHNSQQGATRMGFDPLRHVVYSIHTPRSEAQTKTATRIQLPIHLGNTLMKKIGGSPLSRAQGRVQRLGVASYGDPDSDQRHAKT